MNDIASQHPKFIKNQVNSNIMREAWRIRREAAASVGAERVTFIAWGPCLERARGKRTPLRNAFGSMLKAGKGVKIDLSILDPTMPVNLDAETISELSGVELSYVRPHLAYLENTGVLNNHYGFISVPAERRPYSNCLDDWAAWENNDRKRKQREVDFQSLLREKAEQHVEVSLYA